MTVDAVFSELLDGLHAVQAELRAVEARLRDVEARLPSRLVSVEEAARALHVGVVTIQRMCRAGRLACNRRGHRWLIDLSSIRAVAEEDVAEAVADARRPTLVRSRGATNYLRERAR